MWGRTTFSADIDHSWCYFVNVATHLTMIAMLLEFKGSIYGVAEVLRAYFEFRHWVWVFALLVGLVLSHKPGNCADRQVIKAYGLSGR